MVAIQLHLRCTIVAALLVSATATKGSPPTAFVSCHPLAPGVPHTAATPSRSSASSSLWMGLDYYGQNKDPRQVKYGHPRARPGASGSGKSKRQERVGQLVQSELSTILHRGILRGPDAEHLDDELRQRISVVSADVSPDLKQARVSISVRSGQPQQQQQQSSSDNNNDDDDNDDVDVGENEEAGLGELNFVPHHNPVVDKRRAYAWLVRNTKSIRHTLAQRLSHMKSCPNLTFVQVDVAAATDVMYLIDKVAKGYKRGKVGGYNENDMPTGVLSGIDFDEDFEDDDDWEEEDGDKFFTP